MLRCRPRFGSLAAIALCLLEVALVPDLLAYPITAPTTQKGDFTYPSDADSPGISGSSDASTETTTQRQPTTRIVQFKYQGRVYRTRIVHEATTFEPPRDGASILIVPPKPRSCPSGTRNSRGRCREVW